jgi:lipopolysaccharide export LptBFGC system permease protein LptF
MDCVAEGLNVARNALMLSTVCGGIIGLVNYLEEAKGREWYITAFSRFFILFFVPTVLALASAVSGTYSFSMASTFFSMSCSILLAVVFVIFLYLLVLLLLGRDTEALDRN